MGNELTGLLLILAPYIAISTIYVFVFIDEILSGVLFSGGFEAAYLLFFPSIIMAYIILAVFYVVVILLLIPIVLVIAIFTDHLDY